MVVEGTESKASSASGREDRIFLTQGRNPGLLHCRQILYHLSYRKVLVGMRKPNCCLGDLRGHKSSQKHPAERTPPPCLVIS